MTANKFPGIRAAAVSEPFSARMARRHNDAQILCMGGRVLGEGAAVEVLRAWLGEEFEGGRHERRLALIAELASGIAPGADLESQRTAGDTPPEGRQQRAER